MERVEKVTKNARNEITENQTNLHIILHLLYSPVRFQSEKYCKRVFLTFLRKFIVSHSSADVNT